MKKRTLIFLVIALALSICAQVLTDLDPGVVRFEDMEYVRPDMAQLEAVLAESCDTAMNAGSLSQVEEAIYEFNQVYDQFYTSYSLADIHYNLDLTDIYWEQEYAYCSRSEGEAAAALEELYRTLAQSPFREELESEDYFGPDFFDAYEGQSVWTEEFTALMEQEAQLQSRYYEIYNESLDTEYYSDEFFSVYGSQMEQLFLELIALRQQIAAEAGYDSYPAFAYDMYHYRDFSPREAEEYMQQVGQTLAPLYAQVTQSDVWDGIEDYCTEEDTFAYVKTAAGNLGGGVWDAFRVLEEGGLYHIAYGENKYNTAYETYLWSYREPFVFMSPYLDQSDKLSFAHEFGHFVNDYLCQGSMAGTDVAEVQSQGMEYMSLIYADAPEELVRYKLANSLMVYVEQSAYALFEQQAYSLTGDELTVENLRALYARIGRDFGLDSWEDWDCREYVIVAHLYSSPMYMISYVVSNDVAFQMYQIEQRKPGDGLVIYQDCLWSMDTYILTFAENCGLESPFAPGRLEQVKATLEEALTT